MPSIYDVKPKFQALLRPIVGALFRLGVTPNQVTVLALLLSLATGGLLALYHEYRTIFYIVPGLMFVRMALNAIDGMLARDHDLKSDLGALLNELGDVISDAALFLPFGFLSAFSFPLVSLFVILAVISEMAGVLAIMIGRTRHYDGPMGKSDRAFVFGVLALLIALEVPIWPWGNWVIAVMLVLVVLTIFNRMRSALAEPRNG